MGTGKLFEIFVKRVMINVGFTEVKSDGIYIFDGAPGQMIQGLGEAHNADVLLEPPVQTPFYTRTRLLVECKNYSYFGKKAGLNMVRSVLGLREDINHFDIVDLNRLTERRAQNRRGITYSYDRYHYQVAIASLKGYTTQAQEFAASHRIPLLEFNNMPFWDEFCDIAGYRDFGLARPRQNREYLSYSETENRLINFADRIGKRMAVAITNSGQMLFLYLKNGEMIKFNDYYSLYWSEPNLPWQVRTGEHIYQFQLPDKIMRLWLDNTTTELEMKKEAINYKASLFSSMVVYYKEYGWPMIKMISIDKKELSKAREKLRRN